VSTNYSVESSFGRIDTRSLWSAKDAERLVQPGWLRTLLERLYDELKAQILCIPGMAGPAVRLAGGSHDCQYLIDRPQAHHLKPTGTQGCINWDRLQWEPSGFHSNQCPFASPIEAAVGAIGGGENKSL